MLELMSLPSSMYHVLNKKMLTIVIFLQRSIGEECRHEDIEKHCDYYTNFKCKGIEGIKDRALCCPSKCAPAPTCGYDQHIVTDNCGCKKCEDLVSVSLLVLVVHIST